MGYAIRPVRIKIKPNKNMNIKGTKPDKILECVDLGNGFCHYALVEDQWYSVNLCDGKIADVRWECRTNERDQIIAVLSSRLKH